MNLNCRNFWRNLICCHATHIVCHDEERWGAQDCFLGEVCHLLLAVIAGAFMMQKRRLYNTQNQNEGYGGMCKGAGVLGVAGGHVVARLQSAR